jgi:hypothetical protein
MCSQGRRVSNVINICGKTIYRLGQAQGAPNVVHNNYGAQTTGMAGSGREIPIRLAQVSAWWAPVDACDGVSPRLGTGLPVLQPTHQRRGQNGTAMGSSYSEPQRGEATNS